jgi:hypothetical protein
MIVSFSKRFVFLRPPKCGGTSIKDALWQHCDPTVDVLTPDEDHAGVNDKAGDRSLVCPHIGIDNLIASGILGRESLRDFHVVSIVRNPWDREVSAFWWLHETRERYRGLSIDEVRAKIFGPFPDGVAHGHFVDFVNNYCWGYGPRYAAAEHLFYQDGGVCFDTVLCFERLQDDYDVLCEQLGLRQTGLPQLKAGSRLLPDHYSYYYTEEARGLVGQCHRQTIEHFGYEF